MKKNTLITFLAALLITPCMYAQKLHKIMFGHTTDGRIGETVVVDMQRADNEISEIGAYLNYDVINYIYTGDDCSKENLEKVLKYDRLYDYR